MNKKYAIEILEMVERGTLEHTSPLFREAYKYLIRLKSIRNDEIMIDRLYDAKHKSQW